MIQTVLNPIGEGRGMSASPEGINDNRQNVEHCHDDKHLAIAKGSNQGACNAAAYTDADIIRTQEGRGVPAE